MPTNAQIGGYNRHCLRRLNTARRVALEINRCSHEQSRYLKARAPMCMYYMYIYIYNTFCVYPMAVFARAILSKRMLLVFGFYVLIRGSFVSLTVGSGRALFTAFHIAFD